MLISDLRIQHIIVNIVITVSNLYGITPRERSLVRVCIYSQTCVKRPFTTRHIFGFSDRWLLIKVVQKAPA